MLSKIKAWLQGKKTYLLALSAIVGAVVAYTEGQVLIVEAIKMIIEGMLAMTIRASISTK